MRIPRIYYQGALQPGANISLPAETGHYVINVLRLRVGATVIIFNGDGHDYLAVITAIQKKDISLHVSEVKQLPTESTLKLHLAQAVSRTEKMDWIIQKAVELGVNRITPLITDFCTVKLNAERAIKKIQHWQKIIISACEQSKRAVLPVLDTVQDYQSWIKPNLSPLMLYCDPKAPQSIHSLTQSNEVLLLIGPEGGLSREEIKIAENNNFVGITLGPRILRTETAPIAALAIFQYAWGDW